MPYARWSALAAILVIACGPSVFGQEVASRALQVLESKCLGCHGAAKMSGLDLRTQAAAETGGQRGTALGKLLLEAVRRTGELQMPPGKEALPADEVATLEEWIEAGAPWPQDQQAAAEPTWWSFKAPVRPEVPGGSSHPVDAFLNARHEEEGLRPAPEADREGRRDDEPSGP